MTSEKPSNPDVQLRGKLAADCTPEISIVVPVFGEALICPSLLAEIDQVFAEASCEIIFVDDASQDNSLTVLTGLKARFPRLRVLSHEKNAGQSRALRTGILAARGEIILTLDGDGQNDPADGPRLIAGLKNGRDTLGLIGGERQKRQDSAGKKWASLLANRIRKWLLKDEANDTGCGIKAFYREAFLRLPYFDHMHRYLPALMIREGFSVAFLPVNHRPRQAGQSHYTNFGRLLVAISDLQGLLWLIKRARPAGNWREI